MPAVFKVAKPWTQSYSPALAVSEDERVTLGERDEAWPGWIWCLTGDGLGGWLPDALLIHDQEGRDAVLKSSFNTVELTAEHGEELEGFEERDGWLWCRNRSGKEGWVPLACLVATHPLLEG